MRQEGTAALERMQHDVEFTIMLRFVLQREREKVGAEITLIPHSIYCEGNVMRGENICDDEGEGVMLCDTSVDWASGSYDEKSS